MRLAGIQFCLQGSDALQVVSTYEAKLILRLNCLENTLYNSYVMKGTNLITGFNDSPGEDQGHTRWCDSRYYEAARMTVFI
jgi:hypothetical protein